MSQQPPRAPVYGPVHKAHRYGLMNALLLIGATDFAHQREAAAATAELRRQVALAREHLRHEEEHVHPLVRAIGAEHVLDLETAHHDHHREFDRLTQLADRIDSAGAQERARLAGELYLDFARFIAGDLLHMDHEERVIEPLIQAHYSDEEIIAVHRAVTRTLPLEEIEALGDLAAAALSKPEQEAIRPLFEERLSAAA